MTKYPDFEIRTPREDFTRKLHTICSRLDAKNGSTISVNAKDYDFKVIKAWVVGSYARGATTCGDLDIVVQLEQNQVGGSTVNRLLLGSMPKVSCYRGTPEDNSSWVKFPEAKLIWHEGANWNELIDAIPVDPSAGRFVRKRDAIPLRQDQLTIYWHATEALLADREAGRYEWTFIPLSAITPLEIPEGTAHVFESLSKKKKALVPYLLGYEATRPLRFSQSKWEYPFSNRSPFQKDGMVFTLGGAFPDLDELDNPKCSEVLVMPELNTRGPNGIWRIERGPEHWLRKLVEDRSLFVIESNGEILFKKHMKHREPIFELQLYRSAERAQLTIDGLYFGAPSKKIRKLTGTEILQETSGIQFLTLIGSDKNIDRVPLTYFGAYAVLGNGFHPNMKHVANQLKEFILAG